MSGIARPERLEELALPHETSLTLGLTIMIMVFFLGSTVNNRTLLQSMPMVTARILKPRMLQAPVSLWAFRSAELMPPASSVPELQRSRGTTRVPMRHVFKRDVLALMTKILSLDPSLYVTWHQWRPQGRGALLISRLLITWILKGPHADGPRGKLIPMTTTSFKLETAMTLLALEDRLTRETWIDALLWSTRL